MPLTRNNVIRKFQLHSSKSPTPPTGNSTSPLRPSKSPTRKPTLPPRPSKSPTRKPTLPLRPSKPPTRKPTSPLRPSKPPTRKPTLPPRPSKPPTRKPTSPLRPVKPSIQINQLRSLPVEIFCKIWDNLGHVSASFIKSSSTVSKDVADKIYYCTDKILLDTTDINLDKFKYIKSIKIDYSLNNPRDVKRVSKILTKYGNKVVFDTRWYTIDDKHENHVYSAKKNGINDGETLLPYISQGEKMIIQHLIKNMNIQQLKQLSNAIGISIIHDYNWTRVKCLLDTLFNHVSKKQRYTIVCSMIQPWESYSNGYDHVQRVWFRNQHPKEYTIMTNIPKYLMSKVDDIRQCKNWNVNGFEWS